MKTGFGRQWLKREYAKGALAGAARQAGDPLLQVTLASEDQIELERELDKLPAAVFLASDSLGWSYQFWQAEQKDAVNASGKKIGADELAAVTQLFTEDYMVDFLLHNTLGAWWARKRERISPRTNAQSGEGEDVARRAVVLPEKDGVPEVDWKYLRFIPGEDGTRRPAAGDFEGWPKTVKEIRLLDPCMGSGHFLVCAFLILVRLRMEEEKLSAAEACVVVLRDNLFGLELDTRCTQIAAFNLALAAWKLGGYQPLPSLNLACSGLAPNVKKEDWLKLAERAAQGSALAPESDLLGTREETLLSQKLKAGMERLYQLFQKAPVLGSLINPRALDGDLLLAEFHQLQPLLEQALQREKSDDAHELAVTAQGVAKAAEILARQFTLVATNVPYLGRAKQDEILQEHCERVYPEAKADLATCFMERCLDFCAGGGSTALVTPQNWLFLTSYEEIRIKLLKDARWSFALRLGPGAFETITGEVVKASLLAITKGKPSPDSTFFGLDVSGEEGCLRKAEGLGHSPLNLLVQVDQVKNPDSRITTEPLAGGELLSKVADFGKGSTSGDRPRFLVCFWELASMTEQNVPWLDSPNEKDAWSGREHVTTVKLDSPELAEQMGSWLRGQNIWGRRGVAVIKMRGLQPFFYSGEVFDDNVGIVAPRKPDNLSSIWCFAISGSHLAAIRKIDQKLNVTAATLTKVPFDLAHWQKVAAEKYPNGLPKPFSSDPTQWLFNGHPKGSNQPLHVAVARLVGYRWPRQTGSNFLHCPAVSVDGLESFSDGDGIVCIPSVRGEEPAAERLRKLLAAAYGDDWKPHSELELIRATSSKAGDLDEWLRNDFFEQHCEIFHHRPFIWHVWDGRKRDGFHALVNYHKLAGVVDDGSSALLKEEFVHPGQKVLASLTHSHLGEWIVRQKDGVKRGEEGAEERLAAAEALKERLEAIFVGESPHDLFVRWKPLRHQAIGWTPDINDGVRMNIRPFATADVLRKRVKIKWEKDRGNEPKREKSDFPWFWKDGVFTGERLNDVHLSLQQKRVAREGK
ncbi:MAG: BREX-1 system adenine-specific DNA-methyltransferase PglX [Verrucomicrobiales bacterium]|nr:BREX-1 system adenine-specific DNA-methyltransferase PglX [Verrucomicrobiales bacterium]